MPESILEFHPLLRIAGLDPTAPETLSEALARGELPISGDPPAGDIHAPDPYQVDPALEVVVVSGALTHQPPVGTTYAGLTPPQRGAFLAWAQDAVLPAPPAFQRLLISHVEASLLDAARSGQGLRRELVRWSFAPSWNGNEWLARALLLALWLSSNGPGIAEWTSAVDLPGELLELAVALQMLLHEDLRVEQVARLASAWNLERANARHETWTPRLRSLTESLGAPPLEFVHGRLGDTDVALRSWRTAHRALRFSIPQPAIRPYLQPLLEEMLNLEDSESAGADVASAELDASTQDRGWQLVVEFGQSRSDLYDYVLDLAQRMPGYLQLMDENRRLVHRITIRKREMRSFWRIWDYVQGWSSTRVYLNGEELERWKIWPYSQYLR